jgi:peptide/nickel transport system substrate-binding protein
MVFAACGGGGSKKASPTGQDATTETTLDLSASTSTTVVEGSADSTTSTAVVAGKSTATTAKKSTATTARKTSVTQAVTNKQVTGGIGNVTASPSTAPPADVTPGGTLTYLKVSDHASFDPVTVTNSGNSDGAPMFLVFDALMYSDPATGTVKPQTAESFTSTDGQTWTLKLRPNIKFTDGTAYDASAVKFNWERLADPAKAARRAAIAQEIQKMDVLDGQTLRLTLKAKNAVFPQGVALIPFIASPKALTEKGDKFAADPVGAGPFTLKSWTRDSQGVYVRNPGYWNAPLPYLDQIVMKPVQDETSRVNTFKSGQANFLYTNQSSSALELEKSGGVPTPLIINGGTNIYFNTTRAPFNDIRARQAVAYAIDRDELGKLLDGNVVPPQHSVFKKDSPFYDKGILQLGYDPAKAQQLLDQLAGEGKTLEFTLQHFNTGSYIPSSQYIKAKLDQLKNVKVTLKGVASAQHQTDVFRRNYDAALFSQPFDDPEPTWTAPFTCEAAQAVGSSPTGWCEPKWDEHVAAQKATLSGQERITHIKEMQKLIYAQVPTLYFQQRAAWLYSTPQVQNVQWGNDGLALFDRIWMKK